VAHPPVDAEVAIVGAGPAGLATAIALGQLGMRGVVIADRQDFPRDKTCGSAVSPKGIAVLRALGVGEAVAAHGYGISGLRLVTPRGRELVLSGHTDAAVICCRRTLDHLLLQRAQELGGVFLSRFHAKELLRSGDRVVGIRAADGREIHARYTVVAGGAHSSFGLDRGHRRVIQAIMGWWEGVAFRPNHLEMVFDARVAPLYGWLFPEGPTRVNIGLCYEDPGLDRNARRMFASFLDEHYRDRLAGAQQVGGWKGHPVVSSMPIRRLASPGRIVVGEAGRMTHPATAEGIYQGMRSGMLAAQALHAILRAGGDDGPELRRYERACRKAFATSFRGAAIWRCFIAAGGLDLLADIMGRPLPQRLLARGMARM